ncbi:MAG: hypothetical protein M1832_002734 [Thelocarpon impressellum]|nr:MAG: hypothetical protein M1832_002734 [Thelocarpon impressellum]
MANMATLPPQSDLYRNPGPQDPYRGPPPDHYRGPPQHMTFNQPAPRQRTAIACRYCRRRKIRCSGFESSEDGRCTNCQRFHQECIFTPVSSQAQAFVPAHTAYPQLRNAGLDRAHPGYPQNPPVIYGAHGQPLRTVPHSGPYQAEHGYALASPPSGFGRAFEEGDAGRKRMADEPPGPGAPSAGGAHLQAGRRGSSGEYHYLEPHGQHSAVSPASSAASYHTSYSQGGQPAAYYGDPRRTPPQPSSYPYERGSNSPHGSTSTTSGTHAYAGLHPPQVLPPASATPPPAGAAGASGPATGPASGERRSAMNISNMLDGAPGPGPPGRSATDHEMLDAFMPKKRA